MVRGPQLRKLCNQRLLYPCSMILCIPKPATDLVNNRSLVVEQLALVTEAGAGK